MVLGVSEDFTDERKLDSELTSLPSSGLYLNMGVHPSITVENLLDFLPKSSFSFALWDASAEYNVFTETRNRRDIVTKGSKVYQCIKANIGQDPNETDSEYWLETNIDSLRLKSFVEKVKDKVFSDLHLTKRLINNQFLYEKGEYDRTLPNDYSGWVLEPKGSDYVSIKINQLSIQKKGTDPINLYVINQNTLIKTVTLTPTNGGINFEDVDITFSGKGQFKLIIDSTDVLVGNKTIDPLKFDGFVAYTTTGVGDDPLTADYTYNTFGNGIGMNVTAYLDSKQYIDNNLSFFGAYIRATFEYMVFQLFLHNSSNRSNRSQRIQMNDDLLLAELKRMDSDTVVRRYHNQKKRAIKALEKSFDTQLSDNSDLEITVRTV